MKYFFIFSVGLIISALFIECASRARPGGGPVDKTAPFVLETNPVSDTTNLSNVRELRILFSERMNESTVTQSLFISPPVEFETDWSGGDELTLDLQENLRSDQTYVVTIGSGAQDSRNNRMDESFQLAFSTGSVINRGRISGRIMGVSQQDIYYIYAYQIDNPDSLDPTRVRADYLTQPDKNNRFSLGYLAPGKYRVFVVEDQNKNLLLDVDYERIGIPYSDILIDSLNNNFSPLNFVVTRVDTTAPFISGIRAQNKRTLLLRCSEPLVSLDASQMTISDTLSGQKLEILGYDRSHESMNQYVLFTADHDSAAGYQFYIGAITDTCGNTGIPKSLNYISSFIQDTTGFRIESVSPADSAKNLDVNIALTLKFSLAVDTSTVIDNFVCKNSSGDTIALVWIWSELKTAVIKPAGNFQPEETYTFELNTGNILSLWNKSLPDTLINRTFFIKSADEFGAVSGNIEYSGMQNLDSYVYIKSLEQKKQLQIKTSSDYSFRYDWLPEGNYQIGGFIDLDRNGKLSAGKLIPFTFAEPFHFNEDTIRIRKRWESSDVSLKIPERTE